VLPFMTSNPARHLRLSGRGAVTVGARADLVVLDDTSHAVRDVWCGGVRRVAGGAPLAPEPFSG